MGILCFGASSTLLCGEDRNSVLGLGGGDGEVVEAGSGLDFLEAGALFPVDCDEVVGVLVLKEIDHQPKGGYLERLEQGGFESSCRKDAMDWICKVHSYYNFGPLSLCLSVNYLDRFLSTFNLPHDKSWMQQLMSVACLSLAVKMEETVAPLPVDLQVCGAKNIFEARNIKRMELIVMETLNWRLHAVTPFSFICYFLDKFSEGKPPSYMLASRCAELIVGTVKDYRFLSFRPSEIAAAVVLLALVENQVIGFSSAIAASEIPVNKEMIMRCYELLVRMRGNLSASLSAPQSPIGVLDAACFSFRSDDTTPGSSPSNNNNSGNNDQASAPASKKRRLGTSPI
ncbi:cyclin-D2-2-like [Lolium rigidum]|uniref:cyclin-D2-2-like n=1 Tax=Lolium rigidum TaxID=89674 RepID=UPI001F5C58E8|nr:cyclin-D2-2-like [Lolium rigidum]